MHLAIKNLFQSDETQVLIAGIAKLIFDLCYSVNRPFSYSKKECGSNDISSHFVEFSNVYNTERSSNATQSNLVYKSV